jgi:cell division septum initiation protein DivIVA
MRVLSMVVIGVWVATALSGCEDREKAELEQRNAQLASEKAQLEETLAQVRAEAARLKVAAASMPNAIATAPAAAATTRAPTAQDEADLQAAQAAYVHGDYAGAIKLAKRAAPALPSKAWRVVGASSCFLKDVAGAREAYQRLGDQQREFLRYVCARNAIKLD